jgi:glycine/D-amino acid oxidase-like deaminating enzyme
MEHENKVISIEKIRAKLLEQLEMNVKPTVIDPWVMDCYHEEALREHMLRERLRDQRERAEARGVQPGVTVLMKHVLNSTSTQTLTVEELRRWFPRIPDDPVEAGLFIARQQAKGTQAWGRFLTDRLASFKEAATFTTIRFESHDTYWMDEYSWSRTQPRSRKAV